MKKLNPSQNHQLPQNRLHHRQRHHLRVTDSKTSRSKCQLNNRSPISRLLRLANRTTSLSLTQKQKAAGLFQELNKFLAVRDYRQVLKVTNNQSIINDLRAQILYRLEYFSEAKGLYKKLLREGTDELEEDRENNLLGCEVAISVKTLKWATE